MSMNRTMTRVAALLFLVFAAGCADEFSPASYLNDLRVLGLVATPLEAGPGEEIVISPLVWTPEGTSIATERWSFCPFDLGSAQAYACAVPECLREIAAEADGSIRAQPYAWAVECAIAVGGGSPVGVPDELPEKVDMLFSYSVRDDTGFERKAVLRYPVYTQQVPESRNQHPRLAELRLDGEVVEEGDSMAPVAAVDGTEVTIQLKVDAASMDSYLDEAGEEKQETPIVSFYTTAGRFEYERDDGLDAYNTWTPTDLEPGQDEAEIYVVVRDLRGGQSLYGPYVIPFQ